ncbi:alpha/beta hydrolase [Denitromonas iodatirespirans]|uniref:Alpha/beta hydrolase n=1 Tax=Denitromonas iodatirespirans TaxID=2795389 RepID=A0A944DA84_DENI1|nr:alpha/beta hydrolase [Denitromonas iodatirespirans]MBT0962834.1 alpha/beta hydrolase [Denitromonas iodatirespirans]
MPRWLLAALLVLLTLPTHAGALRDRIAERRQQAAPFEQLKDLAYGPHERQRFDVYLPKPRPTGAPIILLVHGGGWRHGDKGADSVVEHKVRHWVGQGVILVSTNYRLLPETAPLEQADDVARALAAVQRQAAGWGGDANRLVLMGHSAGAHLVALLGASPERVKAAGAAPWRATVALDSAALDLPAIMQRRHLRLYDQAFGDDPANWRAASPLHQQRTAGPPLLAVCSTERNDGPCPNAEAFAAAAKPLGMRVEILPQARSHREINVDLGNDAAYTGAVDAFLRSVDARWPVAR